MFLLFHTELSSKGSPRSPPRICEVSTGATSERILSDYFMDCHRIYGHSIRGYTYMYAHHEKPKACRWDVFAAIQETLMSCYFLRCLTGYWRFSHTASKRTILVRSIFNPQHGRCLLKGSTWYNKKTLSPVNTIRRYVFNIYLLCIDIFLN